MIQNPYAPPEANVDDSSPMSQVGAEDVGIPFDSLPKADKWRFVWGFFWRSGCVAVLSMLCGAIIGAVIGFFTVLIAQAFGKTLADVLLLIRILSGTAGALVGFAAFWQLIRWYFRANWFGHRLLLVKDIA